MCIRMTDRPPFRERWLFARILMADLRRRDAKAVRLLEQLEALRPLKLHERTLKARLLLFAGEPERAHDLFLEVRQESAARGDATGDYIRRYADFWHAHIRWDPFNAREARRAAADIDCSPRLKRLLWIPKEAPDPLNEEFDAWIKANAPRESDLRKQPASLSRP